MPPLFSYFIFVLHKVYKLAMAICTMEETEDSKMMSKCRIGKNILDVVITQEKINGKIFYVAQGIQIDVASQGLSLQEALDNVKDAAEIILESSEDARDKIEGSSEECIAPMITRVCI